MDSRIDLLPYQKRWIEDESRFKIGLWSRQVGKTFASTLEIVLDCFDSLVVGRRTSWVILSAGERQAKEALEQCKRHCQAMNLGFEDFAGEAVEDGITYKILEVNFANGSRILAVPANPATVRGFSANLYLDEMAFWRQSEEIWKAVVPIATRGGFKVRITSTANGQSGVFHRIWAGGDALWSRHQVSVLQAVEQGLPLDVEQLRSAIGDEDAWRQEYLCEFVDEATAWLSWDLIDRARTLLAGKPELYTGAPVFVGIDLAMRRDLWVAAVLEPLGDVLWLREMIALQAPSFSQREAVVEDLFGRYCVARLCLDQTGMGEDVTARYQMRWGSRVEGMLFTQPNKLVLATQIKQVFEDGRIRIPQDQALRSDLHKVKKSVTATGAARFQAESDSEGHADRFWALALAVHGASGWHSPIEFRGLGERAFVARRDLADFVGVGS